MSSSRPIRVYQAQNCGSAIIEAILNVKGMPFERITVDYDEWLTGRAAGSELNPLHELPTIVLPDGQVMTESLAIALWLNETKPGVPLMPPVGDPDRARFLRWLVFLVTAIYPTFTYGDMPEDWVTNREGRKELKLSTLHHRMDLWKIFEAEAAPEGWWGGDRFSLIDLYVGVMRYWRPRAEWFAENCPRLSRVADRVAAIPELRETWKRNFED